MGLGGIWGLETHFWFVCLRLNTVVKVGGDMYKKKIYVCALGLQGGQKLQAES